MKSCDQWGHKGGPVNESSRTKGIQGCLAPSQPSLHTPPPPCASTALSKHMSPCYRRFDAPAHTNILLAIATQ